MIIELPMLSSHAGRKPLRMGFFYFSNNNLAIRVACAKELGGYDPAMNSSEDVDLCIRMAMTGRWVACREPGVVIRHKGRRSVRAAIRQLWGWGRLLGRTYRKTGIRGFYFYYIEPRRGTVAYQKEWAWLPGLACLFVTDFLVVNVMGALSLLFAFLERPVLAFASASIAAALLPQYLAYLRGAEQNAWRMCKLAALHHAASWAFITSAFIGGLRAGVVLVCAPGRPQRNDSVRQRS